MEGKVKWFNDVKGYGFIEGEDGQDYFVHHSAIEKNERIRDNDPVSFDAVKGDRGMKAEKVVLKK
ncbi:MAG: cold shock domain-containing protein [Candidatus Altiarchaeota archaeon]|nr:cold shock domain-containing protein [Candidatus Altiarchaeota archaeon]